MLTSQASPPNRCLRQSKTHTPLVAGAASEFSASPNGRAPDSRRAWRATRTRRRGDHACWCTEEGSTATPERFDRTRRSPSNRRRCRRPTPHRSRRKLASGCFSGNRSCRERRARGSLRRRPPRFVVQRIATHPRTGLPPERCERAQQAIRDGAAMNTLDIVGAQTTRRQILRHDRIPRRSRPDGKPLGLRSESDSAARTPMLSVKRRGARRLTDHQQCGVTNFVKRRL